eukprot:scaffold125818_cov63-Phaeocystis_antarctica.AAC.4
MLAAVSRGGKARDHRNLGRPDVLAVVGWVASVHRMLEESKLRAPHHLLHVAAGVLNPSDVLDPLLEVRAPQGVALVEVEDVAVSRGQRHMEAEQWLALRRHIAVPHAHREGRGLWPSDGATAHCAAVPMAGSHISGRSA